VLALGDRAGDDVGDEDLGQSLVHPTFRDELAHERIISPQRDVLEKLPHTIFESEQ
jgi:hypothetical protein